MPTRNVVLTNYQASFVERLVSTGRYQNASEVLREGLRMVEQREAEDALRLEALRNAVRVGIADMEQGRYATFESGAQLRGHLASVASKAIAGAWDKVGQFGSVNRLNRTTLISCSGQPRPSERARPAPTQKP